MKRLPRSFYARPTLEVAGDLLGKVLVHRSPEGTTSGKIVEVEAYIGEEDPACHAAPGPTTRNQPLYGDPGFSYVYINYGVHFLFNVVTERRGSPAAVLVRALEPIDGMDLMRKRRLTPAKGRRSGRTPADADLCRGPGNLTQAMGITLAHNRMDLCEPRRPMSDVRPSTGAQDAPRHVEGRCPTSDALLIEDRGLAAGEIEWSSRIGISVGVDHAWRAYVASSAAISGRKSSRSTV